LNEKLVGGFDQHTDVSVAIPLQANFALEAGWAKTGDLESTYTVPLPPFATLNVNAEFEALTLRALGFYPIDRFSLVYGIGYFDSELHTTVTSTAFAGTVEGEGTQEGATLVGGLEFNFERIDIRGELEWFDGDDGAGVWDASVGIFLRF
jgi:hypothetical protein